MVVPLAARYVAGAVGLLLVVTSAASVIGTLIVPRSVSSWLTGLVDKLVDAGYKLGTKRAFDFHRRDRILATQAATLLISQLIAWLLLFFVGFSLMFWPLLHGGITTAFATAGPALWEIGEDRAKGGVQQAILDVAALFGIVTITLQIAYLPTLYAEFNRRETEVALLAARAGVPSWGPELLARTHYALGSGVSAVNTLPDLYETWERWSADLAESHTTYLPLVRFRSPRGGSSWVTGLLAVLDSAAMLLSVSPGQASVIPTRLCLRSGFTCFQQIGLAMGFETVDDPGPDPTITLTYDEFLDAIDRLKQVDFPIEREPAEAWPDFVGWRANYEQAAYDIAYALDVVPALWSGPRGHGDAPIRPKRPPQGRPPTNGGRRKASR